MNVTKTVINVGAKRLRLTIHATSNNDSENLYLGSAETYYLYAQIIHPSSPFYAAMGHSDAILVKIRYNTGDTTLFVALLVTIIKERYPLITGLQFTCGNNISVDLSEIYYITTGKTWYESRFGAHLVDEDDVAKFRSSTAQFQDRKRLIPWTAMKQEMCLPLSFPVPEKELQQMYESAVTWQDFFGPLLSRIGMDEFCLVVAPWLHRFLWMMLDFNFAGAIYRIPIDSAKIPTIIYTTE